MNLRIAGAAAAAAVVMSVGSSFAAPGPTSGPATPAASSTVEQAAYVCMRDERGWHYMNGQRRVICRPARPRGNFWNWRCEGPRCGWWHRNERRWFN